MLSEERERLLQQEYNKKHEEKTAVYVSAMVNARHQEVPMKSVTEEDFHTAQLPEQKTSESRPTTQPKLAELSKQKPSFNNAHTFFPQKSVESLPIAQPKTYASRALTENTSTNSFVSSQPSSSSSSPSPPSDDTDLFCDCNNCEPSDGALVFEIGNTIGRGGLILMQISCLTFCYPLFIVGTTIAAIGIALMIAGTIMYCMDISIFNREKNSDIEMDSSRALSFA